MSLTDVFPVEPVTPTTGQPSSRRQARATRCRASSGSGAAKTQPGAAARSSAPAQPSSTTTPQAPSWKRLARELAAVRVLAR